MRRRHNLHRGPAAEPWLPRREFVIFLLSFSAELQSAVGRVCAAAAVELIVGEGMEEAAGRWEDVAAVLIDGAVLLEGSGLVDASIGAGLAQGRIPTVVVGFSRDSAQIWRQAERVGADRVAPLPESAPWLATYLSCLRNPAPGGAVLGVVGGCGGAGASTLSVLVAAGAARQGVRTLLIDGDPWGGGLCTALSAHDLPGLRWPELLRASGAINPEQLAAALPQLGELALLSWDPAQEIEGGPGKSSGAAVARPQAAKAMGEVMSAARGAYGLVVVDLGRTPEAFTTLVPHCNGVALVVPAQLRAAAAARQTLTALPPKPVVAVVRGPLREGLDAVMVAAAVGPPLMGRLPRLRHVSEVLAAQRVPELLRRRAVRTLVTNVLGWMAEGGPGSARMAAAGQLPDRQLS